MSLYSTKRLSQDLIKSQFDHQTKWSVFTGAPSAGKTTVLQALQKIGYFCQPEAARMYIEERFNVGETIENIRADEARFQEALIERKLKAEKLCDPDKLTFFDRAMPDTLTYYRIAGLNPDQILKHCFNYRYKNIFVFDALEFEQDRARTEDSETVSFLDSWLEKDYQALGYRPIRVPVMSVFQRVEFILEKYLF